MFFFTRRKKIFVFSLLLIAALVIVIGIGSKGSDGKWFKNADLKTWFDSWGKGTAIVQPADETPADQDNSGTTITDNAQNNGTDTTNNGTNTENNNGENANNGSNTENNNGSTAETNNGSTATETPVSQPLTYQAGPLSSEEVSTALGGASVSYVAAYGIQASYVDENVTGTLSYSPAWFDNNETAAIADYVVCYPSQDTSSCLVLVLQELNGKQFNVAITDHNNANCVPVVANF